MVSIRDEVQPPGEPFPPAHSDAPHQARLLLDEPNQPFDVGEMSPLPAAHVVDCALPIHDPALRVDFFMPDAYHEGMYVLIQSAPRLG